MNELDIVLADLDAIKEGSRQLGEMNQLLQDQLNGYKLFHQELETLLRVPPDFRGDDAFLKRRLVRLIQGCSSLQAA